MSIFFSICFRLIKIDNMSVMLSIVIGRVSSQHVRTMENMCIERWHWVNHNSRYRSLACMHHENGTQLSIAMCNHRLSQLDKWWINLKLIKMSHILIIFEDGETSRTFLTNFLLAEIEKYRNVDNGRLNLTLCEWDERVQFVKIRQSFFPDFSF